MLTAAGARWLAVSSVEEGVELREAGLDARILVMGGFLPFEGEAVAEHVLTPALHSLEDVARMDRLAEECGRPLAYHLKLDTGMGRLGTRASAGAIVESITAARHARLEGLMTHLASPADFDSPQTPEQIANFRAVRQALCAAGIAPAFTHLASTHAVGYARDPAECNMVRAGLALYGYLSPATGEAPPPALRVAPALAWKARILTVKNVPEGALLGYGGTFRAPGPMRIAVVAAGYADGVSHRLSNCGRAIAAGRLVPFLGSVCMDVITVDISHAPELAPGDEVTLLGEEGGVSLDAQKIADDACTIPYSILCAIGARVRRVYA